MVHAHLPLVCRKKHCFDMTVKAIKCKQKKNYFVSMNIFRFAVFGYLWQIMRDLFSL